MSDIVTSAGGSSVIPRRLDLLVVNPGGRERIYQNLSANLSAVESPIWVGLLAEHARRSSLSVEVLDTNALGLGPEAAAARISEINPVLTAVVVYGHNPNASTHVMPAAGELCTAIKAESEFTDVLLVGGHVSALPERTLAEEAADFVCDGEGPYTIRELVAALKAGGSRTDLEKVRGLVWNDGDQVCHNKSAPLVTALETEMPGMAWDLLPMQEYRAHNWHCFGGRDREPYAALYTTLGCPFKCTFCCIQAPFKKGEAASGMNPNLNSYRRLSPANIVDQIDRLVHEYGVTNIKIADELFVLHKPHVEAICDGLIRRGLGEVLNIWAYARVDTCEDPALLAKLRAAGVRWLAIGIESASERVRSDVEKGYKPEKLMATLDRVRRAGIWIMANYIFGLPEDDHASMRETLDFAKELNAEFANFFSAMAYPGSALYRDAVAKGWELPASWSGYSQHSKDCLPLPTNHISAGEVLAFRDMAFQEYFDREDYRAMAIRTFGRDSLQLIDDMVSQPLERDFAVASSTV